MTVTPAPRVDVDGLIRQTVGNPRPARPDGVARTGRRSFATVPARLPPIRILVVLTLLLGASYLGWRYAASINWQYWPLALCLLAAETASFVGTVLMGLTTWRPRPRREPPSARRDETVDVFITCFDEPVELVRETVRAALAIAHPHRTFLLDDGNSPAMRAMAEAEGADYLVRSSDWQGRERHAKAGNLNNALLQTDGEFILVLDADHVPSPDILDRTLGYFREPSVAIVQTPQWYKNVPAGDPFGSQAPLFYGPIQEGKDGWNAAFFCGSNAVLRREALMQAGIVHFGRDLERDVRRALTGADRALRRAERQLRRVGQDRHLPELRELRAAARIARADLGRKPLQVVTWRFQRRAEAAARGVIARDLAAIRRQLRVIPAVVSDRLGDQQPAARVDDAEVLLDFIGRDSSPLAAIATVRALLRAVDVDRAEEALPVMPMATTSVTEDIATALRLHALGWRSVYHPEILAAGLAPEDARAAFRQRLRWAQGTIQVLLRENPLTTRGLTIGQRLMYLATAWGYFSGFATVVYLAAPVLFLLFGWTPITSWSATFFWMFVPYLVANQLLLLAVSRGLPIWRGQQYNLALFPVWITAVLSAIGNVWFGRRLDFVVTPKRPQGGASWRLILPQLVAMAILAVALAIGLGRLAFAPGNDGVALLFNVAWVVYDLAALSVVIGAITFRTAPRAAKPEAFAGVRRRLRRQPAAAPSATGGSL